MLKLKAPQQTIVFLKMTLFLFLLFLQFITNHYRYINVIDSKHKPAKYVFNISVVTVCHLIKTNRCVS